MVTQPELRFRTFTPDSVQIRHVGPDRQPVMVIDNALENPEEIRALAIQSRYFRAHRTFYYPGYEAGCSASGATEAIRWIARYFWRELYGLSDEHCQETWQTSGKQFFSCFAPKMDEKYLNVHVDGLSVLALVLHLSPDSLNTSTGFWQDEVTGLQSYLGDKPELVKQADEMLGLKYEESLQRALKTSPSLTRENILGPLMGPRMIYPPFPEADHAGWKLLDKIEGRFNRIAIYPGWQFHSICYPGYTAEFTMENARLTYNTFIQLPTPGADRRIPTVMVPGMRI